MIGHVSFWVPPVADDGESANRRPVMELLRFKPISLWRGFFGRLVDALFGLGIGWEISPRG